VEYVSDSAQTPKGWTKYYQSFFNGYLTSYSPNNFNVTYDLAKEIRIIINNLDNPPLQIKNITVSGPAVELVALLKPEDACFLYYGSKTISKPEYDITYFQEKVPGTYEQVSVGSEENLTTPIVKGNPLFESKVWLWVIMIAVMAVLAFFTLRMMKAKPEGQV
jgi:hypothetical protein